MEELFQHSRSSAGARAFFVQYNGNTISFRIAEIIRDKLISFIRNSYLRKSFCGTKNQAVMFMAKIKIDWGTAMLIVLALLIAYFFLKSIGIPLP